MFTGDKNLKDSGSDLDIAVRDNSLSLPYNKLNKLITALYIVTDIMDKQEPVRLKLRTLGADILLILSDINSASRTYIKDKVQLTLTFLDIALSVKLISEMNFNILKKEFIELLQGLEQVQQPAVTHAWLKEFLDSSTKNLPNPSLALKKESVTQTPNISRKQRRDDIIKAIANNSGSATISLLKTSSEALSLCSEKTIQRELISMVKDGTLRKEGEKRWTRYSVINGSLGRPS